MQIICTDDHTRWEVESTSDDTQHYHVFKRGGKWSCTCPDWIYRGGFGDCKHIEAVKAFRVPARLDVHHFHGMSFVYDDMEDRIGYLNGVMTNFQIDLVTGTILNWPEIKSDVMSAIEVED